MPEADRPDAGRIGAAEPLRSPLPGAAALDLAIAERLREFDARRQAREGDIFAKASGTAWGDVTLEIDEELPALLLRIAFDPTRVAEALLAPSAALDLALQLVGACERIARMIEMRPRGGRA
jgi:hypothetical protein